MYCMRWFLPLLLLPFPDAPPFFVFAFLISYFLHQRPCVYCTILLIALFSSTCYWDQGRCWLDTNHWHFFESRASISSASASSSSSQQLPVIGFMMDGKWVPIVKLGGCGGWRPSWAVAPTNVTQA